VWDRRLKACAGVSHAGTCRTQTPTDPFLPLRHDTTYNNWHKQVTAPASARNDSFFSLREPCRRLKTDESIHMRRLNPTGQTAPSKSTLLPTAERPHAAAERPCGRGDLRHQGGECPSQPRTPSDVGPARAFLFFSVVFPNSVRGDVVSGRGTHSAPAPPWRP
jgi:hypothetical protein